ncbi:hypothetical protein [Bacillus infantis]|uniref:hypothetical protein n=1 Tax=Bacillus infantis TaxID=324767 RepID=UPI003016CB9A
MNTTYKEIPLTIKKSEIEAVSSLSGKDYSKFVESKDYILLKDMVTHLVGDSLLSTDFLQEDVCNKYRFIKTGNLFEHRLLIDYSSTEYCKPVGTNCLEDEDILIAKDGNGAGLGEISIYFKDESHITDYICGEILRIRVKPEYDKWFLVGILKSNYFKEYLDIVTPGGSTLRHSKLLALDFKVPYSVEKKEEMNYISLLVQNLLDKEKQLQNKRKQIDNLISSEIKNNCNLKNISGYKLPKSSKIKEEVRVDTGIYSEEYFNLVQMITNHNNGHYYLDRSSVGPGKTPKDYKYTLEKRDNTYLWITPKNITSLELNYETFINTKEATKVKEFDIILSGIRYLGYGFFVDKDTTVYSNQNTLVVSHSEDPKEQIFLLAFFTSTVGKKLQYSWRVDGLVPIIYRDDFIKIPIPNFEEGKRNEIVNLYYNNEFLLNNDISASNYLRVMKSRNNNIGIYQLNKEILFLKKKIQETVDAFVLGKEISIKWHK